MKILFLGDIAWRSGRAIVAELLPGLKKEFDVDLTVANGENARHGSGLSLEVYEELRAAGIDWLTTGDHIWKHKEFIPYLDRSDIQVLRPYNYEGAPGRGLVTIEVGAQPVTLANLMGTVFTNQHVSNPFYAADDIIKQAQGFLFIDFHAEATSEKNTLGHYVDGRAGAVVGTHTHVQTSDERILPKGTAYLTDAGMCGPLDGSIGVSIDSVLPNFLRGMPSKHEEARGPAQLCGVVITVENGHATLIERIRRIQNLDFANQR